VHRARTTVAAFIALLGLAAALPGSALGTHAGSFATLPNSLSTARQAPAAAPLADGRVLLVGGFDGATLLSSSEIFNPAMGAFSGSGLFTPARSGAAAALLFGGKVLVVGGASASGSRSDAALFDPATDLFTPTANPMGADRFSPGAATLPDGTVLVAGGFKTGTGALQDAEIYYPGTDSFGVPIGMGAMGTKRQAPAVAPLPGGKVLIAGGHNGVTAVASAEIYNPATTTFSSAGIGSMSTPRFAAAAAPLPDGRVLVAGGQNTAGAVLASAEVFDPATGQFSSAGIGSLNTARYQHAAVPLPGGRVLIAGGDETLGIGGQLSSAEIFQYLPEPAGGGPSAGQTGRRAAALKRCKKKRSKKARKKCRKKAKKLPL
jgi:hypothetical protein